MGVDGRAEFDPRSTIRAVDHGHRLYPEEPLEATSIEADDHLVIHGDHGNRHPPGLGHELLTGGGVLRDVLGGEVDTPRRKKLFRRVTRLSGRGPVDRHLSIDHPVPPSTGPPS